MGETGIGKTCLVDYLGQITESIFKKQVLHAGVESKEIVAFVEEA
jgi:hypothetical protein